MQFIDLASQYQQLKEQINKRIKVVLNHGKYIMGPEVHEFEERVADYVGVKHTISCANGTDALQLAMMVLDIKEGDAVFCPTFTFFASAEVIAFFKATPVFVDVDEQTFNICPKNLEKQIEQVISCGKLIPKAIIAVDLFGLPANFPEINRIAEKFQLKTIEDAAQGFGGEIKGRRAGSFSDIATTSFFPAKPLGCYGDGGAIFTNNDEYAELLRSLRVHGKGLDKYDNIRIGMNSRLDTIQAAILLEKLAVFSQELQARNNAADTYTALLNENVIAPIIPQGYISSWAQYTVTTNTRDELLVKLKDKEIPAVVYYEKCMHQQSAFSELNYYEWNFPVAEKLAKQVISLPMHPYLKKSDIEEIANIIRQ
ncbi:DegT/DnrJ/EryC1/StrS family aminotransferase [Zooshikella ganghwensis]|uniref:DegT/DnrJ/EryC1/StrS family aminotransferase n=2 Tax=Zooshikella ganghwensis TaxID=202772 RepID=A0A4P9VIX1_9GAMM|nr:DegT/DnrJ/EryC1/StrS family aminotransferase [Zooshikella ganghwensis]